MVCADLLLDILDSFMDGIRQTKIIYLANETKKIERAPIC